jgi:hypothetical protein
MTKGCSADILLLCHFANAHCTGTAPGCCVKSINKMLMLKHHMDWATCMDNLAGLSQHQETFGPCASILQPFKPFRSPGFYDVESVQKLLVAIYQDRRGKNASCGPNLL